jgi:hypothetical protein
MGQPVVHFVEGLEIGQFSDPEGHKVGLLKGAG